MCIHSCVVSLGTTENIETGQIPEMAWENRGKCLYMYIHIGSDS